MVTNFLGTSIALSALTDATTASSAVGKNVPAGNAVALINDEYFAWPCSITIISIDGSVGPVVQRIYCAGDITSVRLKVEQNQLVTDGLGFSLGSIGLQGA
jgi:hypothetical protein